MTMPVMFFAAGLGTRMGKLVADRPKPLIEVGGTTLIDHAMSFADDRFYPKIVNVHYKAPMLVDHFDGQDVLISDETNQLLETGGGLRKALPILGSDTVATMNTDAIWKGANPFDVLLKAWNPDVMTTLLLLVPQNSAKGHRGKGDFLFDENGRLERGVGHIYGGAQFTKTDRLKSMSDEPFSMNVFWNDVAKENGLFGVLYPGLWCDVGQPEGIEIAEEMLQNV